MYVFDNTEINDYVYYQGRYGIEYRGDPTSVFTNLKISRANAGIRICTYNGTIRGFEGIDNIYDVRLGEHNIHLIDSIIDPNSFDWDDCGTGSTADWMRFVMQQSSYNVDVKDTSNQPIQDVNITALDARGDEVFDEYTYSLETIIQAGRKGIAVTYVPVRTNADQRPSRLIKSIPGYIRQSVVTIIRIFMTYKPFMFFAMPGALVFTGGMILAFRFLFSRLLPSPRRGRSRRLSRDRCPSDCRRRSYRRRSNSDCCGA